MRTIRNNIFLFLFCSFSVIAQENDFQTWHSVSLNKKIIKKTNLTLKSSLRLRENSSLYAKQFFDLRIKRRFNKQISYAVGYRYIKRSNKKFIFSNQNRFYADINYNNKINKRYSYSIRNRWQTQGDLYGYKMTLRQKIGLEYNIKKTKLTPYMGTEYFLTMNDGINKFRSTISLSYPLSKNIDFDLSYRIQKEYYVNNPETLYIFECKLSYKL